MPRLDTAKLSSDCRDLSISRADHEAIGRVETMGSKGVWIKISNTVERDTKGLNMNRLKNGPEKT